MGPKHIKKIPRPKVGFFLHGPCVSTIALVIPGCQTAGFLRCCPQEGCVATVFTTELRPLTPSELSPEAELSKRHPFRNLGGGFKYFLFSPLPGEDSHFD